MSAAAAHRKCSVAIIGGGVAGLSCAERLSKTAFDVTVFDTGRLRPGGRCSTRQPGDRPKDKDGQQSSLLSTVRYDHAAQIITAPQWKDTDSAAAFRKQLEQWEQSGVVTRFPEEAVYTMESHRKVTPVQGEMYYGTHGMGSIPESIVKQSGGAFTVHQDVWVSPSNGVKYMPQKRQWRVQAGGKQLGAFDTLVIAHNGKCADRLMSKTPAKQLHALLRVNFRPTVPAHGGPRMTLNSIYSLTVLLPAGDNLLARNLPPTFICGFVENHPALRCITCQTRKFPTDNNAGDSEMETWTILSSSKFANKHKAPQEFLSEETVQTVSDLLLAAVAEAVTGDPSARIPHVLDRRLQLWGAALPLNVWGSAVSQEQPTPAGFLYDATHTVGACGDWLQEASIAGAWTSGRRLADHLVLESSSDSSAASSHGLEGSFRKSESVAKTGIASFSSG